MKMKTIILILEFILIIGHVNAQNTSFEIKGVIKGLGDRKLLLGNKPNGYSQAFKVKFFDSTISKNDSFCFKGSTAYPHFASIEIENRYGWVSFILDNSNIIISGVVDSINYSKVYGSIETDIFHNKSFNDKWSDNIERNNYFISKLNLIRKGKIDSSQKAIFLDSLSSVKADNYALIRTLISDNPDRFISLDKLGEGIYWMDIDSLKLYFKFLSGRLKESPTGKSLYFKIFQKDQFSKKGAAIPDLNMLNEKGEKVSMSQYHGKYVLLDFWASWCGPCIAEFPDLKDLYKKFKNKGFEILGISLDVSKESWKAAVKKYKLPWNTFCDFQGNESPPYIIFDNGSIPLFVLIDRQGKIIDYNFNLEQLKNHLDSIFSN